jgi:transposase
MSEKSKAVRRTYSDEFKQDSVNLVLQQGYTIRGAASAVGVSDRSLRTWLSKLSPEPEPCGPEATIAELSSENKRLKKQLKLAELEREILKKATAYFAKESQ